MDLLQKLKTSSVAPPEGTNEERIDNAMLAVKETLIAALGKHPTPFRSNHEALGVTLEEFVEFVLAIIANDTNAASIEALQCAAMFVRFIVDRLNNNGTAKSVSEAEAVEAYRKTLEIPPVDMPSAPIKKNAPPFNRFIRRLDNAEVYLMGSAERIARRLDPDRATGNNALRYCVENGAAVLVAAMMTAAANE